MHRDVRRAARRHAYLGFFATTAVTVMFIVALVGAVSGWRVTGTAVVGFGFAALLGWLMVGHGALIGMWRLPDDGDQRASAAPEPDERESRTEQP